MDTENTNFHRARAKTHLICKLFKGSATYGATLNTILRILSIQYLLVNFTVVIIAIILLGLGQTGGEVGPRAVFAYFLLQFCFLVVYLTWALTLLHKLTFFKSLAIGILLPALYVGINIVCATALIARGINIVDLLLCEWVNFA
jgi:hypothetical protein